MVSCWEEDSDEISVGDAVDGQEVGVIDGRFFDGAGVTLPTKEGRREARTAVGTADGLTVGIRLGAFDLLDGINEGLNVCRVGEKEGILDLVGLLV